MLCGCSKVSSCNRRCGLGPVQLPGLPVVGWTVFALSGLSHWNLYRSHNGMQPDKEPWLSSCMVWALSKCWTAISGELIHCTDISLEQGMPFCAWQGIRGKNGVLDAMHTVMAKLAARCFGMFAVICMHLCQREAWSQYELLLHHA